MKIAYIANDGNAFDTEADCVAYEAGGQLIAHIDLHCEYTYHDDAGFSFITSDNVADYIRSHWATLSQIIADGDKTSVNKG